MKSINVFFSKNKLNLLYYILGFIILGLGVNIMKASNLGNGAWDTVSINVRSYLNIIRNQTWVTMGMISMTVATIIMIIVLTYRKNIKFLLMLIPIFAGAISMDFWNILVFHDIEFQAFEIKILFFVFGVFILPLGLTLVVKSTFPAFVFDELMLMFVKVFKAKRITFVRLGIELLGISIGALFGYLTFFHSDGNFGAVNIGSFIFTLTLSPIMTFYYSALKVERT